MNESLLFSIEESDGWPPVSSECLEFVRTEGEYELLSVPLFIKGLSRGDVLSVSFDQSGMVNDWKILKPSQNTTIWILKLGDIDLNKILGNLHSIGCNTVSLDELGAYAVDVPSEVKIANVDDLLSYLDKDSVAVAYPSFRHVE
jgi:hypothetical protein